MAVEIHDPGNYIKKIMEVYAFVSVDEGGEGIIGQTMRFGTSEVFTPFVFSDKDIMEKFKTHAKNIAQISGKKVKLIRLSVREELEF